MALTDKIKQYAGDLTGLDSTNAIKQAVDHTIAMAKQVSEQIKIKTSKVS